MSLTGLATEQKPLDDGESKAAGSCSYGCDDIPVANEALEQHIKLMMDKWHAPGLAIAVLEGNKTWAKGFGCASLSGESVTPSTLFYTGSTTKSFTAAALSLLVDDPANYSSFSWTSPIVSFLREDWILSDGWATEHITVEDALSHRTGYPRHDLSRIPTDSPDMIRNFQNLPMSAEPRVKFQYCNLMFGAMGYLVSKLTGSRLADFFREKLWLPMGMETTFLTLADAEKSGLVLADEHWYNNDTEGYETLAHTEFPWNAGAGMTISNVLDYSRYLRVMMNEEPPISKAGHSALKSARSIVAPRNPPFGGPLYYGLGWFGAVLAGEEMWFHSGQVNGHISFMGMIPARQFAVVTMVNAASPAQDMIIYELFYDFLGVPPSKRFDIEADVEMKLAALEGWIRTSRSRLYPSIPDPPISRPIKLENYTGLYHDAGYGTVNITLDCSSRKQPVDSPTQVTLDDDGCHLTLLAPPRPGDEFAAIRLELEHVSSDYWLGWVYFPALKGYHRPQAGERVQFTIDVLGEVSSVGVDARAEGDDTPLVWFQRVQN